MGVAQSSSSQKDDESLLPLGSVEADGEVDVLLGSVELLRSVEVLSSGASDELGVLVAEGSELLLGVSESSEAPESVCGEELLEVETCSATAQPPYSGSST
ncbi:hypothetical protein [Pseudonocardia parietis]|uniref:Uncharacterized protein n=1 Tax=Pseudonocardia parietis TaxID=570936 RepID=A0ABS4VXK1_9PSEU|nr:hypothetical protein [Pseudonocardia parietis]MBP2368667.1 hypothetical protein [Pseudonocardia parietis]